MKQEKIIQILTRELPYQSSHIVGLGEFGNLYWLNETDGPEVWVLKAHSPETNYDADTIYSKLDEIKTEIKRLGLNDAHTELGAIEFLAQEIKNK